jgi:hypothetical protein
MVTMCTQHQSEFELHARAILGLPVDVSLRSPGASAVIYGGLQARGIAFEGLADALALPGTDGRKGMIFPIKADIRASYDDIHARPITSYRRDLSAAQYARVESAVRALPCVKRIWEFGRPLVGPK